ncbi:PREDICTED: uncharacterized protein LOC105574777 [Cercocebus atys]|uniref:uncharacterized protein LOC105574777 n=1 Tax=Cercocebus atys TaxID=9531 RepID=UPI0005F3FF4B|nr:PREDICTED: uncharacterized protein LOC105574777 [Cercocebus atys]
MTLESPPSLEGTISGQVGHHPRWKVPFPGKWVTTLAGRYHFRASGSPPSLEGTISGQVGHRPRWKVPFPGKWVTALAGRYHFPASGSPPSLEGTISGQVGHRLGWKVPFPGKWVTTVGARYHSRESGSLPSLEGTTSGQGGSPPWVEGTIPGQVTVLGGRYHFRASGSPPWVEGAISGQVGHHRGWKVPFPAKWVTAFAGRYHFRARGVTALGGRYHFRASGSPPSLEGTIPGQGGHRLGWKVPFLGKGGVTTLGGRYRSWARGVTALGGRYHSQQLGPHCGIVSVRPLSQSSALITPCDLHKYIQLACRSQEVCSKEKKNYKEVKQPVPALTKITIFYYWDLSLPYLS